MTKALNAILEREYADNPSVRPSSRAVQLVIEASNGDIRSALNTLQFIVGEPAGNTVMNEDGNKTKKKGKKRKTGGKVKEETADVGASRAL